MRDVFGEILQLYYCPKRGDDKRHAELRELVRRFEKRGLDRKTILRKIALYRHNNQ